MRRYIPKLRQASQILISVPCSNIEKSFHDVRQEILKWTQRRAGHRLPENAWEGGSFILEQDRAQPVEAIHLEDQGCYSLRLVDDDKEIPKRRWLTTATISKNRKDILLGAVLSCVYTGEHTPFVPSVPGFVRQVAEGHGAIIDGRPIGNGPWIVDTEEEVGKLFSLLINPDRKHDVCVISTEDKSDDISSTLIEADKFFSRTVGAVHTVVLTGSASYELTNNVGKQLSVYRQAVRTYHPNFDPDESENYAHPVALARKISLWDGGPSAFRDFLVTQCLERTVTKARMRREKEILSYAQVKEIARELRQKQMLQTKKSSEEMIAWADEEVKEMKKQMKKKKKTKKKPIKLYRKQKEKKSKPPPNSMKQTAGLKTSNTVSNFWRKHNLIKKFLSQKILMNLTIGHKNILREEFLFTAAQFVLPMGPKKIADRIMSV